VRFPPAQHRKQKSKLLRLEPFHALAKANQTQYYYCPVNVTDADEISKSLEAVVSSTRFPLRGIVACAGISGEIDAVDYPPETFRKLLDINIMGTFLPVQAAARLMQKQKSSGSVVLVASISGHVSNKVLHIQLYFLSISSP
jgi:NAD(P)-dependent dehydrogenase (short-subunit alcohol dehydrogenase family)